MSTPQQTHTVFLQPLDVLLLRGNKLFGDPGSHGESLLPPWPSLAAGALRSRMLADEGVDLKAFATGKPHPALGTPSEPGPFTVTAFHLARRRPDGTVEILIQPPADLLIAEKEGKPLSVRALAPTRLPENYGLCSSAPFDLLPVLAENGRSKPASHYWLAESGWRKYLQGQTPEPADLVKSNALWAIDHRVGVGLDASARRASEGQLFSMQAVAMTQFGNPLPTDGPSPRNADHDVGFLASVTGATPPQHGTVRLGGDGRAAAILPVRHIPHEPAEGIARAGRCRLVLATPGLFSQGWLPNGMTRQPDGAFLFDLHGVRGRLVCAAVPRAEVVSGWDLAQGQPKSAQCVAPTGSVYWLEDLQTTPDALRKLVDCGLWGDTCEDSGRRAEGFNRVWLAAWE